MMRLVTLHSNTVRGGHGVAVVGHLDNRRLSARQLQNHFALQGVRLHDGDYINAAFYDESYGVTLTVRRGSRSSSAARFAPVRAAPNARLRARGRLAATMMLTEYDGASLITAHVGDTIEICVSENAGAGHRCSTDELRHIRWVYTPQVGEVVASPERHVPGAMNGLSSGSGGY